MTEYDDLIEEARHKTKTTSREIIPRCCEILLKEGLSRDEISRRIREDFRDIWIPQTIWEAIPDEYKKETKPKKNRVADSILLEQSTNGSTHITRDPEPENPGGFNTKGMGVVDPPDDQEMEDKPKKQQPHVTRIVMSKVGFEELIKYMQRKVQDEKDAKKFVIEYDADAREMFVDIADPGEEINV